MTKFVFNLRGSKEVEAQLWKDVRTWLREHGLEETDWQGSAAIMPPYDHHCRFNVEVADDALAVLLKMRWSEWAVEAK